MPPSISAVCPSPRVCHSMRAWPMVKGTLKGTSCVKDPPGGYIQQQSRESHTHQHEDTTASHSQSNTYIFCLLIHSSTHWPIFFSHNFFLKIRSRTLVRMRTPATSSAKAEHTFKEGRDFADRDPSIPVRTSDHDPAPTFVILSFASVPDSLYCFHFSLLLPLFDQDFCVYHRPAILARLSAS